MSVLPRIAMPEYIARGFPVLKELQSDYQHIVISETPEYGRMLFLDGDLQIAESDEIYHQTMIEPLVRRDALGKVLILGGGDGGVLKAALSCPFISPGLRWRRQPRYSGTTSQ